VQRNMKYITENIKINLLAFFVGLVVLTIMLIFQYHIQEQSELDMKELEQIVEKELQETHGKH
jgi:hypothetical protein